MAVLEPLRKQHLDRLSDHLIAMITENQFRLRIGEDDFTRFIGDNKRVGEGLHDRPHNFKERSPVGSSSAFGGIDFL
jgi:hypothetical protein